jgi:outer membrane lipoprotein-sorting protein
MGLKGQALTSLGVALLLSSGGCKPSPDGLIEQALDARGGLERLRGIQTERLTGKIAFGTVPGTLRIEFKRPDRMRMEIGLPGGTFLRLVDGNAGWVSDTSAGHSQLRPMSPEEVAIARREADMDGPLVDSKAKGIRIERVGPGQLQGRATEDLDIIFKDGTIQRYQLDAASHEPVGWSETEVVEGKPTRVGSAFHATKRVEGVLFPTIIESSAASGRPAQHISIEHIELNVLMDDARFRPPTLGGALAP